MHLNAELDGPLIHLLECELEKYRAEVRTCECGTKASTEIAQHKMSTGAYSEYKPPIEAFQEYETYLKTITEHGLAAPCSCTLAPWLKDPARFFTSN